MRVSCCAQEHNIETRPGLEPTRSPVHRTYLHYEKKKKEKRKNDNNNNRMERSK